MHSAIVSSWGAPPKYTSVADIPSSPPDSNLVQIKVHYTGLHQVVKSRASGTHYSSAKSDGPVHHVPGVDGTGTTADGMPVYFLTFGPSGTYNEYINLAKHEVIPLPEGVDAAQVAAFMNPMLSSWMALRFRTNDLPKEGWTALIMGATSSSGLVAAHVARRFGAKCVVGVARNVAKAEKLGFDAVVKLEDEPDKTDFSSIGQVDVVLDYVFGPAAETLLKQIKTEHGPTQYVQVGGLGGRMDMNVPGAVLRSKDITIRGAGPGAWQMKAAAQELPKMLELFKELPKFDVDIVPLSEVEQAWTKTGGDRIVFKV